MITLQIFIGNSLEIFYLATSFWYFISGVPFYTIVKVRIVFNTAALELFKDNDLISFNYNITLDLVKFREFVWGFRLWNLFITLTFTIIVSHPIEDNVLLALSPIYSLAMFFFNCGSNNSFNLLLYTPENIPIPISASKISSKIVE